MPLKRLHRAMIRARAMANNTATVAGFRQYLQALDSYNRALGTAFKESKKSGKTKKADYLARRIRKLVQTRNALKKAISVFEKIERGEIKGTKQKTIAQPFREQEPK